MFIPDAFSKNTVIASLEALKSVFAVAIVSQIYNFVHKALFFNKLIFSPNKLSILLQNL